MIHSLGGKMKYLSYEKLLTMVKQKIGELRLSNNQVGELAKVNPRKVSKVLRGEEESDSVLMAISNSLAIKVKRYYGVK